VFGFVAVYSKIMQITDLFIKIIADYAVIFVVAIGAWAMLKVPKAKMYQSLARGFMVGLTALFIAKIASLLYQGERPFVQLGVDAKAAYLDNPGFPSDHVLLVFVITFIVWASTKNVKISVFLFVVSCLVAIGRILALVHTPIDVVGGIACAVIAALLWYSRSLFAKKTN
jgi:undecaprenyl-diphosphatase